jgi:hypothetical protein
VLGGMRSEFVDVKDVVDVAAFVSLGGQCVVVDPVSVDDKLVNHN